MAHLKACYFHLVRFGEAMELLRQRLDEKNVYYMNPALNLVQ